MVDDEGWRGSWFSDGGTSERRETDGLGGGGCSGHSVSASEASHLKEASG